VTLATALLTGLLPAIRFARGSGRLLLGSRPGHRASAGAGERRLRRSLIVLEIAMTLVLLVGAGLLARSYASLLSSEPGFRWRGVAAVQTFLYDGFRTPAQRIAAVESLLDRRGRYPE
jgi:hypothetical protein